MPDNYRGTQTCSSLESALNISSMDFARRDCWWYDLWGGVCISDDGRRCGGNWTARYKISRPPTTISVVAKIGRNTASGTWAEM
jgi:hypothetical protein